MKETYKIYLIFWAPVVILVLFTIFAGFKYKNTLTPLSEVGLPSGYIEVIKELNSLNSLKPFKLVENYNIVVDPFSIGFREGFTKERVFPTEIKPEKILHLSMIYIEGTKKICIINNNKFVEGSKIERDIKIIRIGDYYVDLQIKNKGKRLLLGQTLSF